MSYEKFVMDLDHCGAMLKLLQGFATDDEAFGRDAYLETGPGENFLSTSHTLRHYTSANFEPRIADAGPFESWVENGSQTSDQRASALWRQMLEDYQRPDMNLGTLAALEDFVAERKAAMPDEWR